MINFWLNFIYNFYALLIRFLPRKFILIQGAFIGLAGYFLSSRHRRLSLRNLELAFGSRLGKKERRRIARAAFIHFGQMVFDTLKFAQLDETRRTSLFKIEGLENLQQALRAGRGILIFSAHLGNWEVASWPVASLVPLHVVARPLDNPVLERQWQKLRQKLGARVISKFEAARPILQALKSNEAVALLIDQNVLRSQAVFVDFFGRLAATTPAVAIFHLRTGAPILPVFCLMSSDKKYCLRIHQPLSFSPDSSPEPDLLLQITQILTKIIEQEIKKKPEQWLWFHDRWRTRPESENSFKFEKIDKNLSEKKEKVENIEGGK